MEIHEIIINKAIKFNNIITYMANNNNVLRDRGLLESAIGGAFQSMFGQDLYPTHEEKAFILFLNIAKNHPFMDGNKRTAALVSDFYLMENGLELDLDLKDKFKFLLNILEKNIETEQALFLFKEFVKPIESITRNPLTKEIEIDFIKKYEEISNTINNNFLTSKDCSLYVDKSLNKNILEKYTLEYSKNKGINYVSLINCIDNKKVDMELNDEIKRN